MARLNNSTLLLPLMAVLALIFPIAFSPRTLAPSSARVLQQTPALPHLTNPGSLPPDQQENKDLHDAQAILKQFFGDVPSYPAGSSESLIRVKYQLDFLFVTIPDPVDSRLPYLFDRSLAAIQRAAETDTYLLASFDLPWLEEIRARAAVHSETSSIGAFHDHHHEYETRPGYLLFRQEQLKSSVTVQALLVFLIGETPTTGIHKEAMIKALDEASWICSQSYVANRAQQDKGRKILSPANCGPFKILGPTFSGSAQSLDFALHSWIASRAMPHPAFRIVSGSATAVSTCSDIFQSFIDPKHVKDWHEATQENEPIFSATVVRDKTTLNFMLRFIRDSRPEILEKPAVALLTEGNTAYGSSLRGRSQSPNAKQGSNDNHSDNDDRGQPKCDEPNPSPIVPVDLTFPLHISRLRSESERVRKQRECVQQNPQGLRSSFSLPLPTEDDSGETKDSVPSISQLDVAESELMLSNLLSTISREQFQYVGIAATDVRDVIFLAREIREHSPSTVIFALNADLIYSHPEAYPYTRGMLVATPYPLFVLNQSWMKPVAPGSAASRFQFPDQSSEGIYNAALSLLNKDLPLLEYASPFALPYVLDPSRDGTGDDASLGRSVPPLWIVTVGRDGFWPVTVRGLEKEDASWSSYTLPAAPRTLNATRNSRAPEPGEHSNRGIVPQFTHAVLILWGFLCFVPAAMFLSRISEKLSPENQPGKKTPRWSKWLTQFSHWVVDSCQLNKIFRHTTIDAKCFFLIGGTASLSVYAIAITAYSISAIETATPQRWVFLLLMISILLLGLGACGQLIMDIRKQLPTGLKSSARGVEHFDSRWFAHLILVGVLLCWTCTAWLIGTWLYQRYRYEGQGVITGFRVVNLFNGVSPLGPLLCVGLAAILWVYCSLRRLTFLAETLPDHTVSKTTHQRGSPFFFSNYHSFRGLQTLEKKQRNLLASPTLLSDSHSRVAVGVTMVLALFWGGYLFFYRLVLAFEVRAFYWLLGITFLLVAAGILSNVMRMFLLWRVISAVLRRLGQLPMRDAFSRFREHNRTLPRMTLTTAPQPLTALGVSIAATRNLLVAARQYNRLLTTQNEVVAAIAAETNLENANASYQKALKCAASGQNDNCCGEQAKAQCELNDFTRKVEKLLDKSWDVPAASPGDVEMPPAILDEQTEKRLKDQKKREKRARKALEDQAEEFLVSRTVHFLTHMFPQLTNLASYSMGCLFLMLMAISSYPLQPKNPFAYFCWFIIFGFVGVLLHIAVQMNRDAVLSCLNGTVPGEIHWDAGFIGRVVLLIVVPVLGLVGVQFPDAVSQILRWVAPTGSTHP